ncbi:SDR family NAD(P)-dependent oxidoreductase [Streptomyces sp. NPDC050743]|uniref:SDR family NAD(P)-dependent oxidoreductase n=1 Tax=Streptomyces sp. NPDC050743 TaxID=3365634 RepID=UPI003793F837
MSNSTPFPLSGRTVLVTGATSGIGLETARQLAERGATVLLHGRTAEEARAAADHLVATAGVDGGQLCTYAADFARLDEVETFVHKLVAEHPHLDVLVNNAGMAAPERHTVTADGNEIAFQVNFLAHYLLTYLLEPALTSDPGGRVVNVSSSLHRTGSIQWADPNGAYYDRDQRVDPAPAATEDRTIRRLNKLADLLVGRTA